MNLQEVINELTAIGPEQKERHGIREEICRMGVPARLTAIKAVLAISDPIRGIGIMGDLISGEFCRVEPIYEPALELLATNPTEASAWYLCELSHRFEAHVSRDKVKQALVDAWKRCPSQRRNIVYTLRKRGFKGFLRWWR
jgi:hypothetical protein